MPGTYIEGSPIVSDPTLTLGFLPSDYGSGNPPGAEFLLRLTTRAKKLPPPWLLVVTGGTLIEKIGVLIFSPLGPLVSETKWSDPEFESGISLIYGLFEITSSALLLVWGPLSLLAGGVV